MADARKKFLALAREPYSIKDKPVLEQMFKQEVPTFDVLIDYLRQIQADRKTYADVEVVKFIKKFLSFAPKDHLGLKVTSQFNVQAQQERLIDLLNNVSSEFYPIIFNYVNLNLNNLVPNSEALAKILIGLTNGEKYNAAGENDRKEDKQRAFIRQYAKKNIAIFNNVDSLITSLGILQTNNPHLCEFLLTSLPEQTRQQYINQLLEIKNNAERKIKINKLIGDNATQLAIILTNMSAERQLQLLEAIGLGKLNNLVVAGPAERNKIYTQLQPDNKFLLLPRGLVRNGDISADQQYLVELFIEKDFKQDLNGVLKNKERAEKLLTPFVEAYVLKNNNENEITAFQEMLKAIKEGIPGDRTLLEQNLNLFLDLVPVQRLRESLLGERGPEHFANILSILPQSLHDRFYDRLGKAFTVIGKQITKSRTQEIAPNIPKLAALLTNVTGEQKQDRKARQQKLLEQIDLTQYIRNGADLLDILQKVLNDPKSRIRILKNLRDKGKLEALVKPLFETSRDLNKKIQDANKLVTNMTEFSLIVNSLKKSPDDQARFLRIAKVYLITPNSQQECDAINNAVALKNNDLKFDWLAIDADQKKAAAEQRKIEEDQIKAAAEQRENTIREICQNLTVLEPLLREKYQVPAHSSIAKREEIIALIEKLKQDKEAIEALKILRKADRDSYELSDLISKAEKLAAIKKNSEELSKRLKIKINILESFPASFSHPALPSSSRPHGSPLLLEPAPLPSHSGKSPASPVAAALHHAGTFAASGRKKAPASIEIKTDLTAEKMERIEDVFRQDDEGGFYPGYTCEITPQENGFTIEFRDSSSAAASATLVYSPGYITCDKINEIAVIAILDSLYEEENPKVIFSSKEDYKKFNEMIDEIVEKSIETDQGLTRFNLDGERRPQVSYKLTTLSKPPPRIMPIDP